MHLNKLPNDGAKLELSWNRGAATLRVLTDLVRTHNPLVVGLIETKAADHRMEVVKRRLGFQFGLIVNSRGKSGGLALFWNEDMDLRIISYSQYHIDAIVTEDSQQYRMTLFYGNPRSEKRKESWNLLRTLKDQWLGPWIIFGDFNEVLFGWEVKGKRIRGEWQMKKFRQVLQDCNLFDLSFKGYQFTFSNKRKKVEEVRARLDRSLANSAWNMTFLETQVLHEVPVFSDHAPLIIKWKKMLHYGKLRLFKFEPMWLRHEEFSDKVAQLWESSALKDESLVDCLSSVATGLRLWNKNSFGNVKQKIESARAELNLIQMSDRTEEIIQKEEQIKNDLNEWLSREELLWKQRSRSDWLREGDRNTRYFHLRASQRRKINLIEKLKDNSDVWVHDAPGIVSLVFNYFENIFRTSRISSIRDLDHLWNIIPMKVTDNMRSRMSEPVTYMEIQDAVFQMCPSKASGIDGFSALFYQNCWDLIKFRVTQATMKMIRDNKMDKGLNKTFITLIPKKRHPERVEDFRPISLCNVGAKLVTKVLANRIKPFMAEITEENQSAFTSGKLISDNICIAYELINFLRLNKKGKYGYFALKLVMSNAFDRVEWEFLEIMMTKLGLSESWISAAMHCVSSVTYAVRVNDQITKEFIPQRGIRQGDSLSPYLFLLCAEWLSLRIKHMQAKGELDGIKINNRAPEITHLLFADDSIVFLRADQKNSLMMKQILSEYELLSGQKVNFSKSEIMFSTNVADSVRHNICSTLGIQEVESFDRYLGIPLSYGCNKTQCFKYIIQRVCEKVNGWKEKSLSIAGKELLIKAVIQAIPVYLMRMYKLPDSIMKRIKSIVTNYWWSNKPNGKGVAWCKYKVLCAAKDQGGLQFKDLSIFNDALLASQVWRILTNPDSLMSKLLKARYYKYSNVLDAQLGYMPSFMWRSLWNVMRKYKDWIAWDEREEKYIWLGDASRVFSTKSAYEVIYNRAMMKEKDLNGQQACNRNMKMFWNVIWRSPLQPKLKFFCWRLYHDFLPTTVNLSKRGMNLNLHCPICNFCTETTSHSILSCWWAQCYWKNLGVNCSFLQFRFYNVGDWLWYVVFNSPKKDLPLIFKGARDIWFMRNEVIKGGEFSNPIMRAKRLKFADDQEVIKGRRFNIVSLNYEHQWSAPPDGVIKINSDGSWDMTSATAGIGICGRDHLGNICITFADWCSDINSIFAAEALALQRAMLIADSAKLSKVIFEIDCADLMKVLMQGPTVSRSQLTTTDWCRSKLMHHKFWKLNLVFREANVTADWLANKARYERWKWDNYGAIPACLVIEDQNQNCIIVGDT